jgi:hypothetical protein
MELNGLIQMNLQNIKNTKITKEVVGDKEDYVYSE